MRVLVTGGAGYIGAHTVRDLLRRGDDVVVVDDLSTGDPGRLAGTAAEIVPLDLRRLESRGALADVLSARGVEAVIHFAARKRVEESLILPAEYSLANVASTAIVLAAMRDAGCRRFVLSSTAAVYGDVDGRVAESAPADPITPYGATKLQAEQLASWASTADDSASVALRYFNVAGAAAPGLRERGAANLIPMVVARLDAGQRPQIFGDDYDTDDGTCVRDYVHVSDVSAAHLAVLDATLLPGHRTYNVGTGIGTSVAEIVRAVCEHRGVPYDPEILPRRSGDSPTAVADVALIKREVGWSATRDLTDIVRSTN